MVAVTVVMPVYNKARYLQRSIASVLGQSFTDFEIILVDDGSLDQSGEIIKSLIRCDSRCRYIFKNNGGVSSARNLGIEMSCGKYISFLDADDQYEPRFLEEMIAAIGEGQVAYCGHYTSMNGVKKKARFDFNEKNFLLAYLANRCTPNTNSWMIKRDLIVGEGIRFQEGVSWGEDMMFFSEVIAAAHIVSPCPKFLSIYNLDVDYSLSTNSVRKIDEDIRWLECVKDTIKNRVSAGVYRDKCTQMIDQYRLPAAVIYRLHQNYGRISVAELKSLYAKYRIQIDAIGFVNGLRSIKLFLLLMQLRLRIV